MEELIFHFNRLQMALVKVLKQNTIGTDYAIGDVHGAFDLIIRAMEMANFDQSIDRLLGCGDYIDRGPHSHRTAKFLRSPFVEAVRGNHDQYLLDLYKDGAPEAEIIEFFASRNFNGMGWMATVKSEVLQDIVDEIAKLPIVIEVPTERGTVGIVHADIPRGMNWETFKRKILEGDALTTQCALEGRDRLQSRDQAGVEGVGRVFVGHTIQEGGFAKLGNVIGIDTGGVFGQMYTEDDGHLTMMNVKMCTQVLQTPRSPGLVDLRHSWDTPVRQFSNNSVRPR